MTYHLDPMICRTCGTHGWIDMNNHYRNSDKNFCHKCGELTMSTAVPYAFPNFNERYKLEPGAIM